MAGGAKLGAVGGDALVADVEGRGEAVAGMDGAVDQCHARCRRRALTGLHRAVLRQVRGRQIAVPDQAGRHAAEGGAAPAVHRAVGHVRDLRLAVMLDMVARGLCRGHGAEGTSENGGACYGGPESRCICWAHALLQRQGSPSWERPGVLYGRLFRCRSPFLDHMASGRGMVAPDSGVPPSSSNRARSLRSDLDMICCTFATVSPSISDISGPVRSPPKRSARISRSRSPSWARAAASSGEPVIRLSGPGTVGNTRSSI